MNKNHLFSVNYDELSQDNANLIKTEVAKSYAAVSTMSMTKNRNNKEVYLFSLSSVQNAKIVILNEENDNSVVITPTEVAPAQFELSPFFIEELIRSVLGDADRYLVIETDADFSIRNAVSVPAASREEVFIPRFFYGLKDNVKEALPKDRQIVHIFKEKPKFLPAFPDDPDNLRLIARLEEDMCYYVYMYQLADETLCIYDENLNMSGEEKTVSTRAGTRANIQFYLTGNLTGLAYTATLYALNTWSARLEGTVPIDIRVDSVSSLPSGVLGRSYTQPHYWYSPTQTWYCASLGNQIAGYNANPSTYDIRLEINSTFSWFYGTTGYPSGSEVDWITVLLHEISHGLGFSSLVQSDGSYAYVTSSGTPSGTAYPSIFDRQLYDASGANLPTLNQSQRAALIISDDLYSGRPSSNLLAANNLFRVKMYAPNPWSSPSSVVHWDTSVTFTTFMIPGFGYGFRVTSINIREVAIMRDMGWKGSPPFYIAPTPGDYSGGSTTYANSSGYASFYVYAYATLSFPNSYVWSAQFYGQCNRWYLWPSYDRADISVYLDPGHSGGTLRIECGMYIGGTIIGTAFYYLEVLP